MKVSDYMGFGSGDSAQLEYFDGEDYYRIGEMDQSYNLDGRGLEIQISGNIYIQYSKNGNHTIGKYIHIYSGGDFAVGELYLSDCEINVKGTEYKNDGTSSEYHY